MPIYEFVCTPCKDKFEILTSPSRIDEAKCPKCGSARVKRIFSTFFANTSRGSSSSQDSCTGCAATNCTSCSR